PVPGGGPHAAPAGADGRDVVRGLRPAVHASAVPGRGARGRGRATLSLPQRSVRLGDGSPDRRAAAPAAGARHAGDPRRRRLRHGDGGWCDMNGERPHFIRSQRMTIVNGMLTFVILIVILQLWLLTATMNAYLGGDTSV